LTDSSVLTDAFSGLDPALRAVADPARVERMVAYMRGQFPFLGVMAADRRRISRSCMRAARSATPDDLLSFAERCWDQHEREFQYIGADVLRAGAASLRAGDLARVRALIQEKSWWDTVDSLAAWTVGPMVANHALGSEMDRWIDDPDLWVARTAVLHQLSYKDRTDARRLFDYVERRADEPEFFMRKALGWALRQHARQDPEAVRTFIEAHRDQLSGLTVREALRRL